MSYRRPCLTARHGAINRLLNLILASSLSWALCVDTTFHGITASHTFTSVGNFTLRSGSFYGYVIAKFVSNVRAAAHRHRPPLPPNRGKCAVPNRPPVNSRGVSTASRYDYYSARSSMTFGLVPLLGMHPLRRHLLLLYQAAHLVHSARRAPW